MTDTPQTDPVPLTPSGARLWLLLHVLLGPGQENCSCHRCAVARKVMGEERLGEWHCDHGVPLSQRCTACDERTGWPCGLAECAGQPPHTHPGWVGADLPIIGGLRWCPTHGRMEPIPGCPESRAPGTAAPSPYTTET